MVTYSDQHVWRQAFEIVFYSTRDPVHVDLLYFQKTKNQGRRGKVGENPQFE